MTHARKLLPLALVFAVAPALASCGGGGAPAAPPPPAPSVGGGAAAPAPAPAGGGAAFDPAKATATVKVTALLAGDAPKMRPVKFDADPECGKKHTESVVEETVVASGGKLANVVVYVSRGHEKWSYKTAADAVVIDQDGCMYKPHVLTVMTGQPITIKNSDPVMHNVHAVPKTNKEFNHSQIKESPDLSEKFGKAEVGVKIKCDVHGWMGAWVSVFDHPFHAVTGADGTASLKLPAGDYEITVWHEKLAAPAVQKVTVGESESKDLSFSFAAK